jgi:outer membrane protein assembly factor BamB
VYVSSIDTHTVHALDAEDGKPLWSFTAGGRVDSPPTIHGNLVLFGSADGWVYALAASDGQLAWRLRAAPESRNIVAFGRVESAWPVHGSVLVRDGVAHFAAGRSSYLDGGIHVFSADPKSGEVFSHRCIDSPDPETGKQPMQGSPRELTGALSDVMVGSPRGVTMRQLRLDGDEGGTPAGHLISNAGFLDDSWFNRAPWMLDGVAGQLLVFDERIVCGIRACSSSGKGGFVYPGKGYGLFAVERQKKSKKPVNVWKSTVAIRPRAAVLAAGRLFIAGPPDAVDPDDPWAAFEGRKGGVLMALSATDGNTLNELPLDAPPVFDGLIATPGRLYFSTTAGRVVCLRNGK